MRIIGQRSAAAAAAVEAVLKTCDNLERAQSGQSGAAATGPPSWGPDQVAAWLREELGGEMQLQVLADAAAACVREEIGGAELLGYLTDEMKVRELLKLPFGPAVVVAKRVAALNAAHDAEIAAAKACEQKAKDVLADAVDEAAVALLSSEAVDEMIQDM